MTHKEWRALKRRWRRACKLHPNTGMRRIVELVQCHLLAGGRWLP